MQVDRIEHKELLLKMFEVMNFPGAMIELALELKYAIQQAEIKKVEKE